MMRIGERWLDARSGGEGCRYENMYELVCDVRVVYLLFEMCGVFGDGIIDGIIILLSSS